MAYWFISIHRNVWICYHSFVPPCIRPSVFVCHTVYRGVLVAQRFGPLTFNQAVMGSIPGRVIIKSPRSTQPSIPPG